MTYSSAMFDQQDQDLIAAQENKYRRLAEELQLKSHHRVLEIGCGWGGFAEFAARNYGCRIVCLTLSREQFEWTQQRIGRAGLSARGMPAAGLSRRQRAVRSDHFHRNVRSGRRGALGHVL